MATYIAYAMSAAISAYTKRTSCGVLVWIFQLVEHSTADFFVSCGGLRNRFLFA